MIHLVAVPALLLVVVLFFLRPSKGGEDAPPMISATSSVPFFGAVIEFVQNPLAMVKRCYTTYGPVYTIPILHRRITFLVGPKAQEPFFKLGDDYLSPQEEYGFMKSVFGPNVVYDATKKNRAVQFQSMANGLRASRLKGYVAKIEKETRAYLKEWGDNGEVDLLHALSELTILTATRTLHGNDVRENMFKEVAQLFHDLDHGISPLSVFWPTAPTKAHATRDKARIRMVELFSKIIKTRRDTNNAGSDGTDILSIFMDVKYKDGTKISDEEITGLLIALLFAGQHTSCISSTWTSLFIAHNPKVLKKVIEEQNQIFSKKSSYNDPLEFDDVNNMEYLHFCMREALRLCPPLILLMRRVKKDIKMNIDGKAYRIPKGDTVMVSPYVGMRLEGVFKDAATFEPERYEEGREEHKIPYAYLGFGGGMHSCMGQNFGFLQVKTILSVLFREYNLTLLGDEFPQPNFEAMVVGPKGDCRVRYERKQECKA